MGATEVINALATASGEEARRDLFVKLAAHDEPAAAQRLLQGLREETDRVTTAIVYHLYKQPSLLLSLPKHLDDELRLSGPGPFCYLLRTAMREHRVVADPAWIKSAHPLLRRWVGDLVVPQPQKLDGWTAEDRANANRVRANGYALWGNGVSVAVGGQALFVCPTRVDNRAKHAAPTIALVWFDCAQVRSVGEKKIRAGQLQDVYRLGDDLLLACDSKIIRHGSDPTSKARWTQEVRNLMCVVGIADDSQEILVATADEGIVYLDARTGKIVRWNYEA